MGETDKAGASEAAGADDRHNSAPEILGANLTEVRKMRVIRIGEHGREVITTEDPPKFRKGGLSEEIITTGNIEEILRRRKAAEEEARAKFGAEAEEKKETEHEDER